MTQNFKITGGTGFQMEFENGYRISIQFGRGNYCQNRDRRDTPNSNDSWESATAEVAVIDPKGAWATRDAWKEIFGIDLSDDVSGWVSPDEVAKVMSWAAAT